MPYRVTCECGNEVTINEQLFGRGAKCIQCGRDIGPGQSVEYVPAPTEAAPFTAAAAAAAAPANGGPRPSVFVTVVAWVFIVLTGFGSLLTCAQNAIIVPLALSGEFQQEAIQSGEEWVTWLVPGWFLFAFVMNATTLVASIGVLRRWNWARRLFIGILGFGIAWCLVGAALQSAIFLFGLPVFSGPPPPREMLPVTIVISGMTWLFSSSIVALFVWIIRRLVSDDIRLEFGAISHAEMPAI
jgi:hypothetical protein